MTITLTCTRYEHALVPMAYESHMHNSQCIVTLISNHCSFGTVLFTETYACRSLDLSKLLTPIPMYRQIILTNPIKIAIDDNMTMILAAQTPSE